MRRGAGPGDSPNPFEKAIPVLTALEEWARGYETEGQFTFWGGTISPKAQIHEVRPEGPAWTNPQDRCFVFLDVRMPPEARPMVEPVAVRLEFADPDRLDDLLARVIDLGFVDG